MIIDIIFGILGLLALIIAAGSCIVAGQSDREIDKIVNKGKDIDNK